MDYILTLNPANVQYIVQCLENGPYRLSAPALTIIMEQVRKQDAERQNLAQADSEKRWADVESL